MAGAILLRVSPRAHSFLRRRSPHRVALVFERKKVVFISLVEATINRRDGCRLADRSGLSELILIIVPIIDGLYARLYDCVM